MLYFSSCICHKALLIIILIITFFDIKINRFFVICGFYTYKNPSGYSWVLHNSHLLVTGLFVTVLPFTNVTSLPEKPSINLLSCIL